MFTALEALIAGRDPRWRLVASEHLEKHGSCAVCGRSRWLQVHHIRPFHLFPELELDPDNLVTLCVDGPGGMNCHLVFGHRGSWRLWNPHVVRDAAATRRMLKGTGIGSISACGYDPGAGSRWWIPAIRILSGVLRVPSRVAA